MAGYHNDPPFLLLLINMLMNIFESLMLFGVGFVLGGYIILNAVRELANDELTKRGFIKNVSDVVRLNMELINGIYYIFNIKDNTFVCQGKTLEETFKLLLEHKMSPAIIEFEDKKFIIKDGIVLEVSS